MSHRIPKQSCFCAIRRILLFGEAPTRQLETSIQWYFRIRSFFLPEMKYRTKIWFESIRSTRSTQLSSPQPSSRMSFYVRWFNAVALRQINCQFRSDILILLRLIFRRTFGGKMCVCMYVWVFYLMIYERKATEWMCERVDARARSWHGVNDSTQ